MDFDDVVIPVRINFAVEVITLLEVCCMGIEGRGSVLVGDLIWDNPSDLDLDTGWKSVEVFGWGEVCLNRVTPS